MYPWAGAFGMTQFMPATHVRHMTDGDGDGRIDTLTNTADALATTVHAKAALLSQAQPAQEAPAAQAPAMSPAAPQPAPQVAPPQGPMQ